MDGVERLQLITATSFCAVNVFLSASMLIPLCVLRKFNSVLMQISVHNGAIAKSILSRVDLKVLLIVMIYSRYTRWALLIRSCINIPNIAQTFIVIIIRIHAWYNLSFDLAWYNRSFNIAWYNRSFNLVWYDRYDHLRFYLPFRTYKKMNVWSICPATRELPIDEGSTDIVVLSRPIPDVDTNNIYNLLHSACVQTNAENVEPCIDKKTGNKKNVRDNN